MKNDNSEYLVLGAGAANSEGESVELTELELNLILGGYEPGYNEQQNNPSGNAWDLRGSSSGSGGQDGAGGQGGNPYPGSDPGGGSHGAGGGGSAPTPAPAPEPYYRPEPSPSWDSTLMNWVNRVGAGDGSQLLRIPLLTDVLFPPPPTT